MILKLLFSQFRLCVLEVFRDAESKDFIRLGLASVIMVTAVRMPDSRRDSGRRMKAYTITQREHSSYVNI